MSYTGTKTNNKYTSHKDSLFGQGPAKIPGEFFGPKSWFFRPSWEVMAGKGFDVGAISVHPDAIAAEIDTGMYPTQEICEYAEGKFTHGPVDLWIYLSDYAPGKEKEFADRVVGRFEKYLNPLHYQHPFWDVWLQAPAVANGLRRGYEAYSNSNSYTASVGGFVYGWGEFLFGGGLDGVPILEASPVWGTNILAMKGVKNFLLEDQLKVAPARTLDEGTNRYTGPRAVGYDVEDENFDPKIDGMPFRENGDIKFIKPLKDPAPLGEHTGTNVNEKRIYSLEFAPSQSVVFNAYIDPDMEFEEVGKKGYLCFRLAAGSDYRCVNEDPILVDVREHPLIITRPSVQKAMGIAGMAVARDWTTLKRKVGGYFMRSDNRRVI